MLTDPSFPGTMLRLRGKGSFVLRTRGTSRRGVCVRGMALGKGTCAGGCVSRGSVVTKNRVMFAVKGAPGGA